MEAIAHTAADQERVATARGEQRTGGYATFELHAGAELLPDTRLRFGVDDVGDRWYVNGLNARNPFTGAPIAEPGRVVFIRLEYAF